MSVWDRLVSEDGLATSAWTVALSGMLVVFSALAVISAFIWFLPKALKALHQVLPEEHEPHVAAQPAGTAKAPEDPAIAAAIGYAMHLDSQKGK